MTVLPSEGESHVTKSTARWHHGRRGMGNGYRSPELGRVELLFWAQVGQAETKDLVSSSIDGHQNCLRRTGEGRVKKFLKKCPSGLPGVEAFSRTDILEVLVVCPHHEWQLRLLQPVAPFLQGQLNSQQFQSQQFPWPQVTRETAWK